MANNKLYIKKDDELMTIIDEKDIDKKFNTLSYDDLANKPTIPSDIDDLGLDTVTMTVTYEDDSTEDIEFVVIPNEE